MKPAFLHLPLFHTIAVVHAPADHLNVSSPAEESSVVAEDTPT